MLKALSAYKNAFFGVAILAALALAGTQTVRLSFANANLTTAKAQAQALQSEKATLTQAIETQNLGIKSVKTEAERLAKAADIADKAVASLQAESARKVAALEAQKPETCQAALDVLANAARGVL